MTREAVWRLSIRRQEETIELPLCTPCIRYREGLLLGSSTKVSLSALLTAIMSAPEPSGYCPFCGYDSEDLYRTGKAGCPECYLSLREAIVEILSSSIGYTRHRGKVPPGHRETKG